MRKTLIIELHHLPCIQYFVYLESFDHIIIPVNDPYSKQSYRNRCRINGANKVENLTIPIKKIRNKKALLKHVEIDNNQKWLMKHLRAIQSAYGKAPFFEHYADEIFDIYRSNNSSLAELNQKLLTKCLEFLDVDYNLQFDEYFDMANKNDLYDAINEINPKNLIEENSIYSPTTYFQIFGNNFAPNLSIIDLIFCEGPQARHIIQKSCAYNRQI